MAELSSWTELGRWTWVLVRKGLPQRLLRLAWKNQQILQSIHVVHYEQWPRFYLGKSWDPPQLDLIGFNLFNYTPFALSIVGVDLRVSIDSREWLSQSQRLPSEIPLPAFGRSGYHFKHGISESQAQKLRERPSDWVQVSIDGHLILKSIFGELRREIHSAVVATIDLDQHLSTL